jgi:hypothetical protein
MAMKKSRPNTSRRNLEVIIGHLDIVIANETTQPARIGAVINLADFCSIDIEIEMGTFHPPFVFVSPPFLIASYVLERLAALLVIEPEHPGHVTDAIRIPH